MTSHDARQHRTGLALIALAALAWSSAGLFVRGISADLFTMLFWRGLFSGSAVLALFFFLEGRRALDILKKLRWPTFGVMLASATSMVTGIGSMRFTAVADALTIYATVPFMTAAVAWIFIGERPSRATMIASAVALGGVLVMLGGAKFDGSLFGKMLAVGMTLGMAVMTTIMRSHREVPMLPAVGFSAWLCSAFCLAFAAPLSITPVDLALCAAFGVVQNAAGLALYALGSQRIPAAEATLIAALEVPLTPLWVWLAFAETPATATLIGGGIVLAAMFGHIVAQFKVGAPVESTPLQI
jgi:drug/metabolite transporter (DMT)-like permease